MLFVWQHYIGHLKELIWVKSKNDVGIRKLRECATTIMDIRKLSEYTTTWLQYVKCCGVN